MWNINLFILVLFIVSSTKFVDAQFKFKADFQREFSNILQWEPTQEIYTSSWFQDKLTTFDVELNIIFSSVGKQSVFLNRYRGHKEAAQKLKSVFLAQESLEDVLRFAGALRDHPQMNKKLWLQALVSAKSSRPDMASLSLPSCLVELMPDEFIPTGLFEEEASSTPQICLVLNDRFGVDNGAENALWYFREDLMANSHHWLWHIYYTTFGDTPPDRRGELFSFMHHEFLARYHSERVTHGLPGIELGYITPMEVYHSHLSDRNSGRNYTDREPNTALKDIAYRFFAGPEPEWYNITVLDQINIRSVIREDIQVGYLISSNGSLVKLDEFYGIDMLADVVESSVWSVNPGRYSLPDGIHNDGHALISMTMTPFSPNATFGVNIIPGVMAATSTSLRDPIFYRWHTLVENFFLEHKNTLEPYSPTQSTYPLKWKGVNITEVKVIPESDGGSPNPNALTTFWATKKFNFTRGLDHSRNASLGPVFLCAKHLDHVEFDYEFNVENFVNDAPTDVTVRIFMARREDANSKRYTMEEQRPLFFTMDQFSVTLDPGTNKIVRNSRNSSLTIPFESWKDLEESDTIDHNCGCGWPHHLLLPKGSAAGTTYDLFVMITQGNEDTDTEDEVCDLAPLWCGLRGKKYPSRFPLGYPFDRLPYLVDDNSSPGGKRVVANLDEYINGIPNMSTVQVRIHHLEN